MSGAGPGNCGPNTQVGADGRCYRNCPTGWSPVDNGPQCALNCPPGYLPSGGTQGSSLYCIRPWFARESKPAIGCPAGADRQYDNCLLDCPVGTTKQFNLCVPACPPGFVESPDGLSCQAELTKRTATVREACYANETRIGGRVCLGPCDAGTQPLADDSEFCYTTLPGPLKQFFWTGDAKLSDATVGPVIAKVIFARSQANATCLQNFESINGQCLATCPTGSTAVGNMCVADCPAGGFKTTPNQTACLRPTKPRQVVTTIGQTIEHVIGRIFFGILVIIGFSFVASNFI